MTGMDTRDFKTFLEKFMIKDWEEFAVIKYKLSTFFKENKYDKMVPETVTGIVTNNFYLIKSWIAQIPHQVLLPVKAATKTWWNIFPPMSKHLLTICRRLIID